MLIWYSRNVARRAHLGMKDLPRSIHWVTTSSLSFFPTLSSPFLEKLPKTSFLSSFLSNQTIQISLIHQIDIICYFKSILHFISFYYTKLLRKTRIKNIPHIIFISILMLKKELFKERARTNDPPRERKGKKRGEESEIYRREEKHDRLLSKRKSWGQFRGGGGGIT